MSAHLTRWLDRLNRFDITLKHTAGKEINLPDFISCNPTKNAEPGENCKEEIVINAIAQPVTINRRIGREFDQSENSKTKKTADMLDTHAQTGTRCRKTNESHSQSVLAANQTAINTHRTTRLQANMDNNNINNRQNPDQNSCNPDGYTREATLRDHWGGRRRRNHE